jgi:UDP-4-amino-4,6-dideoxy-N-acetyl-beta-L-altrosamine transaminase
MRKIPYGRQHITQQDIDAVVEVLKSDYLTQGPKIREFEEKFAQYVDAKYAVAVSNGTAALHLSNLAIGTKLGDKVITTPITFIASANSVLYSGGEIDFVDIDRETYLIDLYKLEEKLANSSRGTYKGVIPVDFAGYPVDVEHLRRIADKYGLWIIEDACHAPGGYFIDSENKKQFCGNGKFSDLQIFSFHPVKHIACGEGGMITTNNEKLYKKLLNFRTHGIQQDKSLWNENHGLWYYEMQELGFNYRLSDIQSALGISQLTKAKEGLIKRQEIAAYYDQAFKDNQNIVTPYRKENIYHAFHLYVIQVENRDILIKHLRENNIFAQVHYIPVHLQQYYRKLGWGKGDMPVAEDYYSKVLSIPIYPTLTRQEQDFVIEKIVEVYI